MTKPNQIRRRPSSLEVGRAERALFQLAALLAALAGFIDAVGLVSFGHVFLASPDATVLGANAFINFALPLFAGAMVLSFFGGVVFVTLTTFWMTQFRRTAVLLATALMLIAAYGMSTAGIAFGPAILLAMAMGSAHSLFERDNPQLNEAMSPSAQIGRFGEAIAGRRAGANHHQIGLQASFWLAFLVGGLAGAGAWMALDG